MATISRRSVFFSPRAAVLLCAIVTVVAMALYVLFIFQSVKNVVLREELLVRAAELHTEIGELEAQYLAKKQTIDETYAQSLGFVAVRDRTYIDPVGEGSGLTVNQ